jgi:hypothetical protein
LAAVDLCAEGPGHLHALGIRENALQAATRQIVLHKCPMVGSDCARGVTQVSNGRQRLCTRCYTSV